MSLKKTAIKYCLWCGQPFELKSPNQKYCPINERNCSKEAKRETWRKASSKYRKKYKDHVQISQVFKLGSGFLSNHPHDDFNEEYLAIQKEKRRLRLKGILGGFPIGMQYSLDFSMNIIKKNSAMLVNTSPELSRINPMAILFGLIVFLILIAIIIIINDYL